MTLMIEREVKLRFATPDEARAAIIAAGPLRCAPAGCRKTRCSTPKTNRCAARRCVLRVRTESGKSLLTFKGPVLPGPMKVREEHETVVGDGEVAAARARGARAARLVPLREVPRGVRAPKMSRSRSTRRRSAPSSRSKAAKRASSR